jgi:hypothetical protein
MGEPGSEGARFADALKVCFAFGVFQNAFEHYPRSGSHNALWLRYYGQ